LAAWAHDPRVEFAESDGGLKVRVPDDDWFRTSPWCKLIGHSVDATVRQLLREMKWSD
jgi:hypothetical protein